MTSSTDALSDVLRAVHLKACVYFVKDMAAPWGMDMPAVANGPLHMVLEGSCILLWRGQRIDLKAGDAVLLPHGATHQMLDAMDTVPEPGLAAVQRLKAEHSQVSAQMATRMLCGHFEWEGDLGHPLFRELPDVMVVRGVFSGPNATRFRAIVDLITSEITDDAPGGTAIADRLGEVLFVSLLRAWIVERQPDRGILATIHDPRLSRALRHMHRAPEADLNLDLLARIAGMSRTSFATKFHDAMGVPPATYLASWRMLQARNLLLQTKLSTADIGGRVGYGSDAAFSRAFKREYGVAPSELRKSQSVPP